MKSQIMHITAVIVLITIAFTNLIPFNVYGDDENVVFDGTQSSWAENEIQEAYKLSLTYADVMSNFRKNITREEFCTLVIKLYEKLTAKTASPGTDPFKDTNNKEILKAFELGIVKGTSSDTFSPNYNITRQEMCVMIFRALSVSFSSLNMETETAFPFKDEPEIASWAKATMKFAYKHEIMKGVSADRIDPLSNTTREQGIVLLLRTYKKFSGSTATGTIKITKGPKPINNDKQKFAFTVNSNNIFFPKFDQRIELFVSDKAGKPLTLPKKTSAVIYEKLFPMYASLNKLDIIVKPDLPPLPDINDNIVKPNLPDLGTLKFQPPINERPTSPFYTKSDYAAFIDKSGDKVRWFAFNLKNATGASKVVWQVSKTQFTGFKDNWKTQPGILLSGEVSASNKEFLIDFSKLSIFKLQPVQINSINRAEIINLQKTYYVRAVPVDSSGNPIGDPGQGIAVIYGNKIPSLEKNNKESFELWTPMSCLGSYTAENSDRPRHDPIANGNIVGVDPKSTTTRLFYFHDIDEKTTKIIIQVYSEGFKSDQNYLDRTSIVYEKEYVLPVPKDGIPSAAYSQYNPSVVVPFADFGKKASEMVEEEYINYFVRGIAIRESEQPGKEEAVYSDVVNIQYGFGKPVQLIYPPPKYDKYEKINISFPIVRIKGYKSVQWADPEYLSHYYVYRKPEPMEIMSNWLNVNSGETLRSYYEAMMNPFSSKKMTDAEYRAVIDRVLPVGAKIYIPEPEEKDKEWYEELFDGVVGFFKDIVKTVAKIYSKIQQTYEKIKSNLVTFVANLCPIESLRGYFKQALEALINGGMIALGLPPTLPNFEKLAEENIAYFAQLALTEAGVPPNEITDELTEKVSQEMLKQFAEGDKTSDENPVGAPFLKLDPDYLYSPAYVELEMENNTDYPTVPGTFDLNVHFKLDENGIYASSYDPVGLSLTNDTNQYGYDPYGSGMMSAVDYRNHFVYGLNGYTVNYLNGDEAVYEVFKPVINQTVPVIPPHTKQTMKVYLDRGGYASASRYPTAEGHRYEDFYNMYFENGNKDYTWFELAHYYPTAEEYLRQEAESKNMILILDSKTDYSYYNGYDFYTYYDGKELHYFDATGFTEQMQMPVNVDW